MSVTQSPEPFDYSPKSWSPLPFMLNAVRWLVSHNEAALFLDPGLRKTSCSLAAFKHLKRRGLARRALVIAPLRVCSLVWPAERAKWLDFAELTMTVLHGKDKERLLSDSSDIHVINPDGLEWLLDPLNGKVHDARWKFLGYDTLIIDELTQFKNVSSKRFKLIKQVLPTFKRRWGLTGSPASNGLIQLFGQCYMLDQGKALGKYVTHFRSKYFDRPVIDNPYLYVIKPGAEEQIHAAVNPLALRMAAEDYIQMPEVTETVIKVDLPDSAREFYDQMEDELIAILDEKVFVAANAGVALGKCRQVAAGAIYGEDRSWSELHTAKLDALEELVESLQGQQLLVAYEFQHDLERIQQRFGDIPYIGGGISPTRSKEIVDQWNRGEIKLLLAHPQAAGHGLNMQASGARHVCWLTPTWDFETYDQLNRRLRRGGSMAKRVFIHKIVARGTVDEVVVGSLRRKERGQSALFKALVARRR